MFSIGRSLAIRPAIASRPPSLHVRIRGFRFPFAVAVPGSTIEFKSSMIETATAMPRESLHARECELQVALDSMVQGLAIFDRDGSVRMMNAAARAMYGFSDMPALNEQFVRDFESSWPDGRPMPPSERPSQRVLAGEVVRGVEVRGRNRRSGKTWAGLVTGTPVRRPGGGIEAAVLLIDDVTDRIRVERALRESEERFRLVVASASLGTFDHDMFTGDVELSPAAQRIVDVDQPCVPLSVVVGKIHPDDVAETAATMQRATDPSGGGEYRVRYRVVHRSGSVRWVDAVGRVEFALGPDEARLARRRAGVIWDVTENQRLVEGLRLADQRKDEFLAMLAHELRNPLAPLRNALRIFSREPLGDRGLAALAMGERQVRHMVRLVDDLLEVSRVSRGKIALRCEPMVVATAIYHAVESVNAAIDARGQELRVVVPERPLRIVADPVRIAQVLENLLTNASKYTPAGGHLRVEVEDQPPEVEIRVIDDGVGIDRAKIPHLFELFSQIETTMDRAEGGLGIGLALVKRLVALHGGTVGVTSAGRGRGATFTVRLPRDGPPGG
jgi:PAS domain S-box-containing protein